jgi:FAD/FMN-containing dehydrogenase
LKLTPAPSESLRLLCGLPDMEQLLPLFSSVRSRFAFINAFEYISRAGLSKVTHHHGLRDPFQAPYPAYVLIELEQLLCGGASAIEEYFCTLIEEGIINDVVVSQNSKQADELLALRERISETLSTHYVIHKNDISVPISAITEFLQRLEATIAVQYPGFEVVNFGHLGDGNIHVNYLKPPEMEEGEFFRYCHDADHSLFALVREFGGSVSAEHGVGLLKREFLHYTRSAEEIEIMRKIKAVFDPQSILNPGKIFI